MEIGLTLFRCGSSVAAEIAMKDSKKIPGEEAGAQRELPLEIEILAEYHARKVAPEDKRP